MIGIVVVSHSRALAEAAVGLASEMVDAGSAPALAVAAGLDATTFGTDATAVSAAIEQVDSPDGVLVLLDLGSAVLSAEMALEFLDPDLAGRVRLSSAPLVEGLVAAVVIASTGAELDAVADEATHGLSAKQAHLDRPEDASDDTVLSTRSTSGGDASNSDETTTGGAVESDGDEVTVDVVVTNEHGLHARPAAKVVMTIRAYDASVTLTNLDTGRGPVSAGSLSGVATLDARTGHRVRVVANGPQAGDAVEALEALARRGFDDVPSPSGSDPGGANAGRSGGSGLDLAIGPARVRASDVDTSGYVAAGPAQEEQRSLAAIEAVRAHLEELERRTTEESGAEAGAIFAAHLTLLDDPAVGAAVRADLAAGKSAAGAWRSRLDAVAADFTSLADPYQRERAADVRSVQAALLRELTGAGAAGPATDGDEAVILIVAELDATTAASIDTAAVAGVATTQGGTTGHGVIVASSRGIPVIAGVGAAADGVQDGQLVAFDARTQTFWPDVDEDRRREIDELLTQRRGAREQVLAAALEPAVTVDGATVRVLANIASAADAAAAASMGAEGSGLVRTEVLFGDRRESPGVDEQAAVFTALAAALGGRPLTIRTWDVGGDKPLPFHPQDHEDNPFLGERGIRVFRRSPSLLTDQLAAICVAARDASMRVMFPMVTERSEVTWALAHLREAAQRVGGVPDGLQVGIMVEVPAAALTVESLADGLDFVSIGTNDLTQYTVAADRGNAAVAHLADALTPGVVRLVARVCERRPAGVEVAVCGDLASRPEAVPLLLGLGVGELSCTPPQVPEVKAAVRRTELGAARRLAAAALTAPTAEAVRALLA